MADLQDWTQAYIEMATLVAKAMPEVKWIDLWHEQDYEELSREQAFPLPAIFIEFDADTINDLGNGVQELICEVRFHIWNESIAETFRGSVNISNALKFKRLQTKLYKALNRVSGEHFSPMRRNSLRKEKGDTWLIHYSMSFETIITDYTGQEERTETVLDEILVTKGEKPSDSDEPLFHIDS